MNMHIFQVKSNGTFPETGNILIASPLLNDYHFARSVILMIDNNEGGSMGVVLNKKFKYRLTLDRLLPELEGIDPIPIYKGGPMDRNTIFFVHLFKDLEGALNLGNGLYLNGDFEAIKEYIRKGEPVEGKIRFYAGYAGWEKGQLKKEIREDSWITGNITPPQLMQSPSQLLWEECLASLGSPYTLWAKYPQYPSFN